MGDTKTIIHWNRVDLITWQGSKSPSAIFHCRPDHGRQQQRRVSLPVAVWRHVLQPRYRQVEHRRGQRDEKTGTSMAANTAVLRSEHIPISPTENIRCSRPQLSTPGSRRTAFRRSCSSWQGQGQLSLDQFRLSCSVGTGNSMAAGEEHGRTAGWWTVRCSDNSAREQPRRLQYVNFVRQPDICIQLPVTAKRKFESTRERFGHSGHRVRRTARRRSGSVRFRVQRSHWWWRQIDQNCDAVFRKFHSKRVCLFMCFIFHW